MVSYIEPLLVSILVGVLELVWYVLLLHCLLELNVGSPNIPLGMLFNWKMFKNNSKWGYIPMYASHKWIKIDICRNEFRLRWGA